MAWGQICLSQEQSGSKFCTKRKEKYSYFRWKLYEHNGKLIYKVNCHRQKLVCHWLYISHENFEVKTKMWFEKYLAECYVNVYEKFSAKK